MPPTFKLMIIETDSDLAAKQKDFTRGKWITPEVFWSRVDKTPGQGPQGDCWEWKLRRDPAGYGKASWHGRQTVAHRVAFELAMGKPPVLNVLHSCDNPACCNPDHLREGTQMENVQDRVSRQRGWRPTGERNPRSLLTVADVGVILQRLKNGETQTGIAKDFRVSHGTIAHIHQGISWTHVPRI